MFKQNSEIAILGARFFYYVKLIFDQNISGVNKGNFLNINFVGKPGGSKR